MGPEVFYIIIRPSYMEKIGTLTFLTTRRLFLYKLDYDFAGSESVMKLGVMAKIFQF